MSNPALVPETTDRHDYADSVGYIRVKEKRDLLNHARLQELLSLDAAGIADRLRQGLRRERESLPQTLDGVIGAILEADYAEVSLFDHRDMVVPLLRHRHDSHNLRALIRQKLTGLPFIPSPVAGNYSRQAIESSLFEDRALDWPPPVAAVLEKIRPHLDGGRASAWMDMDLDLAFIESARLSALRLDMPLVSRYFACLNDFNVVKFLWRRAVAQQQHLPVHAPAAVTHLLPPDLMKARDRERLADALLASPYGPALREGLAEWKSTGSWMLLEKDMDNFLLGELAATRYISLGPEPLFAYLSAREHDLKNIRLLYTLKESGWPHAAVKKHLRRFYV